MSTISIRKYASENGALAGLVVLALVIAVMQPAFLNAQNLLNVGVQAAVIAIMAFGMTFVVVAGGIDLSVGSIAALAAMVGALTAGPIGLVVGALCGLVNGALISYGKLPPFIATLAMLSVARGLTLVFSEGQPHETDALVTFLGSNLAPMVPLPLLLMLAFFGITGLILTRTNLGRRMYAIGGNEEAAKLSGIDVRRQKLWIYALSGLFAAAAGLVLAGRLGSAGPQAAVGYELDAIAAVVIGGASLSGGVGRATGTLVGALVLAVLRNGLNLLQVPPFWQQVVIGAVIALAALLDSLRRR
ncbi:MULTISPECIES: ABC transporter permease [Lentzea]|uniref:Ribose transport system permease protein n=1 Tax=Lentzea flaviverrucosa TaxID=200379 RepID=A0A1H9XU49_9PSEU|nr:MULTISPECIES: ABC transporter permease [Lentzea]MCR3747036.1 ribose transport system permease protein [Lentzea californiensis]RDI18874.1 ribose transport system permease protein [Lentzea flaviverrucosa]SES49681.1 ribose transport system permease protein [Lentzea flaviverrucosa]